MGGWKCLDKQTSSPKYEGVAKMAPNDKIMRDKRNGHSIKLNDDGKLEENDPNRDGIHRPSQLHGHADWCQQKGADA